MKCQNCQVEIPSQFAMALKTNSCPSCGQNIYADTLVDTLVQVIKEMSNNPKDLAQYLIVNFQSLMDNPPTVIKVESTQVDETDVTSEDSESVEMPKKKYIPKPIARSDDEGSSAVATNKETTPFFKRTGITPKTSKDLSSAAQIIRAEDLNEFNGFNDLDVGGDIPETSGNSSELDALFDHHTSQTLELEKLKRLQSQGGGSFKKSE